MKKIFLSILFLIFGFLCFGCINETSHEHKYSVSNDELYHFSVCDCGDIIEKKEHEFYWIIDVEPTVDSVGFKHQECKCGYEKDLETEIDKIIEIHTHSFKIKYNEEVHYKICECNFKTHQEQHKYKWVVDVEPTVSDEGLKHQECECGYKVNEKTIINKLKEDELPYREKMLYFNDHENFYQYLNESNLNILFIDDNVEADNVLYDNYYLYYDEDPDKEYVNQIALIEVSLYFSELGTDTDPEDIALKHSITFVFVFYPVSLKIQELKFEFYSFNDSKLKFNNLIYIYSSNELVGKIFYYSNLNIEQKWIETFLDENLIK